MSMRGSGLQEDGDVGAAETSAPQSPPRAAWHLTQRPTLTHSKGGAGRMEQQRSGGQGRTWAQIAPPPLTTASGSLTASPPPPPHPPHTLPLFPYLSTQGLYEV